MKSLYLALIFSTSTLFAAENNASELTKPVGLGTRANQQFIKNYGGKDAHQMFLEITPKIIEEIKRFIFPEKANANKVGIKELIDFIGKERKQLARASGTKEWEFFGMSRRRSDGHYVPGEYTPLYPNTYSTLRQRLGDLLNPILQEMLIKDETKKVISYTKNSFLEISLAPAKSYNLTEQEIENLRYSAEKSPSDFRKLCDYISAFSEDIYGIERFIYGEEDAKKKITDQNADLNHLVYITVAFSIKIGGEKVRTSTGFTRYSKDPTSKHSLGLSLDSINEIAQKTAIIYQHTIQTELTVLETKLSDSYKKIRAWKKNNKIKGDSQQKELLGLLAEFHYVFDHMMPYVRGSAAAAEWAVQALAREKGYTLSQAEDVISVCQEALAQPDLDAFIKWYKNKIILNPLTTTQQKA